MVRTQNPLRFATALVAAAGLCLTSNVQAHGGKPPPPPPPPLVCDAGGPYFVDCGGSLTTVQLDGSGSVGATSYHWSTTCHDAYFSDDSIVNPVLYIVGGSTCGECCQVRLTVSRGDLHRSCSSPVRVRDNTPPVIQCPELFKLICGGSTAPSNTGFATATDNCDPNPTITYKDKLKFQDCPAERLEHTIERTWKAKDHCGNWVTCLQEIHVVKIPVQVDALPGACPNVLSGKDCSLFPIAVLGSDTFDVTKIQWNSVKLFGEHCAGGPVHPKEVRLQDVASPFPGGDTECACHDLNGDGKLDLNLKFRRSSLVCALGLNELPSGTPVRIVITGKLQCDGCHFVGTDCIVVP